MVYKKYIKRSFDFISALALLIAISPVFFILCILIRINLGNPIFFLQKRAGKNGKAFNIIKFRTMIEAKDKNGNYLPDEKRKTKLGTFLRSTSLDELPELINIIKGDMSVVGPRSLPVEYNKYYTKEEENRFKVRGGLIPPDMIINKPTITWKEQLECEAYYGKKLSAKLDIKIFIAVFKMLFMRNKIDYGGYVRESLISERQKEGQLK